MKGKPKLLFINTEIHYSNLGPKRKSVAQLNTLSELFEAEQIMMQGDSLSRFKRAFHFYILYPLKVLCKVNQNKGAFVYYRYYPNCLLLNWFLYFLRKRISLYVEVNTKHRDEFINEIIKLYIPNLLSEKLIYSAAHTVLVITPEVGEYVRRIEPRARIRVMGNGYDPAEIDMEGQAGGKPQMAELEKLVAQAAGRRKFIWVGVGWYWDGLDRILALMEHLDNACLFVVANRDRLRQLGIDPDTTLPERVFFLGQRNLQELKYLYDHCDFGLGSFGQDRKNMTDNPTLKVREYLYFGLPVIMGHRDSQLEGLEFVHQYQDMGALRKFLAKDFDREYIKQYAREHLSWRTIMRNVFAPELTK